MKLFPLLLVSLVVGGGLGTALAYVAVGTAPEPISLPIAIRAALPDGGGDAAPTNSPPPPMAKVRLEEQEFNFGVMQRGAKRSHEFILHNDGDAPLRITVLATSCKCTVGETGSGPIEPGESAPVKLEWVAKSLPGPFRQTANLETNDPRRSNLELAVAGDIVDATGLAPQDFSLGRVSTDETREASVVFMAYDRDDLVVTADPPDWEDNPGASEDSYEVRVEPVAVEDLPDPRAKSGSRITLKVNPGLPIGVINGWVTLYTNLPEMPELQAPVFGRVEGDLSIHGPRWSEDSGVLAIGIINGKQGHKTKLRVSIKGERASNPQLRIVEVDPPELKVTLGEARLVREGVAHVPVEIAIAPGTRPLIRLQTGRKPDGTYQHPEGVVRLATGGTGEQAADAAEIELRVRFAVGG